MSKLDDHRFCSRFSPFPSWIDVRTFVSQTNPRNPQHPRMKMIFLKIGICFENSHHNTFIQSTVTITQYLSIIYGKTNTLKPIIVEYLAGMKLAIRPGIFCDNSIYTHSERPFHMFHIPILVLCQQL